MEQDIRYKGVEEMPKVDINPFVGKTTTISDVQEKDGIYGKYLLISAPAGKDEESGLELTATRILNLNKGEDEQGVYYFIGAGTKAESFLKKMGIDDGDYMALIGRKVQLTKVEKGEDNFLSLTSL